MKILYIGDFKKKNGPSMVDISLNKEFDDETIIKEQINKNIGLIFLKNFIFSKVIVSSGVSFKGTIAFLLSKLFQKKTLFIMHGSLKMERDFREINNIRLHMENILIEISNLIIGVSKGFSEDLKEIYPKNSLKINYVNNGVDFKINLKEKKKEKGLILSVGGGRAEKGILNICRAIQKINNENIKLLVVGEEGKDTEKIKEYKFVNYLGFVDHIELMRLMEKSEIFIQNSYYESFGIAPLEALIKQCKVIGSRNVNSLKILRGHVLVDNINIDDIAKRIEETLNNKNIDKYTDEIEKMNWKKSAKEYSNFFNILGGVNESKKFKT